MAVASRRTSWRCTLCCGKKLWRRPPWSLKKKTPGHQSVLECDTRNPSQELTHHGRGVPVAHHGSGAGGSRRRDRRVREPHQERPTSCMPVPAFMHRSYVHIHQHQCHDFSISVFCFTAGATLPLHNHPMVVALSSQSIWMMTTTATTTGGGAWPGASLGRWSRRLLPQRRLQRH
ncbi:hypothetical protein SORBI_3002G189350 [Sorghum bicolor]|uniref:cysteine dioxygenase n=1 Tax=Sorghum bicolor TaxID=4558 RepID=A0A1W0W514_SORBI|nr:hypothetical protein SORBI_3002G189350 [Sorghum bicolor]